MISVIKRKSFPIIIPLVLIFFANLVLAEDTSGTLDYSSSSVPIYTTEDEVRSQARLLKSFADFFRDKTGESYKGVLIGNILSLDADLRYLYFKPRDVELPRMFIYIDKKTIVTRASVGKRRRVRPQAMIEGARVAVRVFIKHGVIVADEVFLVEGEFEPPSRYEKKKFAAKAAPAGASEKKPEGGGH
ncbi:MAG TPA: hypothetical protein PKA63_10555 [Oligoflexia bacterium]|nr:hypothetical protein [Oligoflexia bacterium]HMP49098.1 hypothetical protein [Oligoflexia bacterium]